MKLTNDSVVIITGASAGIGRALAKGLAEQGVRLALFARREELLEKLRDELETSGSEVLICRCDVTVRDEFQSAVEYVLEHYGQLDVLINNAGRGHFGYIESTPDEHIEEMFRVNTYSLWYGTSAALKYMRPHGRGHIINIASMAGVMGFPGNAAYVAAKHAMVGFTRALRTELAGTGVEASVVIAGSVETDWAQETEGRPIEELFAYETRRGIEIAEEDGRELPKRLPLLQPEDLVQPILALVAEPVPELYTHEGARELIMEYRENQREVETLYEPFYIANREGYELLQEGKSLPVDEDEAEEESGDEDI